VNFEAYESFKPNENFLKNGRNFWFMVEFFVSFCAIWMLFEIDLWEFVWKNLVVPLLRITFDNVISF